MLALLHRVFTVSDNPQASCANSLRARFCRCGTCLLRGRPIVAHADFSTGVDTYAPSGTVLTLLSEKKGSRPSLPLLAVATGTDSLADARARMADQQQRLGIIY